MNHAEVLFATLLLRDPEVSPGSLLAGLRAAEAARERGTDTPLERELETRLPAETLDRARRALARAHHAEAESALIRLAEKDGIATRDQLRALVAESRERGFAEWLAPLLVRKGLVREERIGWLFEQRRFALADQRTERVKAFIENLAALPPSPSDEAIRSALAADLGPDELLPVLPVPSVDQAPPPSASPSSSAPRPLLKTKDSLIHGYEIARRLDKGGMGVVYKARHLATGRIVALKILPLSIVPASRAERFRWECLATLRLDHEHLVKAFDFGACESYYYLALELLEGECLSARIKSHRIPDREALPLIRQLAFAIEDLERVGLVHRDVKPSNCFIHEGRIKLYDLGLAKFLGTHADGRSTDRGGTPQYLSPEQVLARETVDKRSDFYSLGISLFHLVTAKLPFHEKPIEEILRDQIEVDVPDPRTFDPFVTAPTAAIVRRLTRKDRDERYQTAAELVADIDAALESLRLDAERLESCGFALDASLTR